jgi:hypothetical protein
MSAFQPIEWLKDELDNVRLSGYRETMFFSTVKGQLCQWIEFAVQGLDRGRKLLRFEIRSRGRSAQCSVALRGEQITVRGYAPALWPEPPDPQAALIVSWRGREAVGMIAIGGHRPWTLYLLSDCCADDSWAYGDLEQHDHDDYLTTKAELEASADNSYNYPSVYQIARFSRYATANEWTLLGQAFHEGRFYLSPVPNQLLCGAFVLAAYPLLLEPYRHWRAQLGGEFPRQNAAYHMEAPTWTNGLANLFSCAGFRMFGKSLLRFLSPWMDRLEELPALTRLQVAPQRYVHFLLCCNTYAEGFPLLAGQPQVNETLHETMIPRYARLGDKHPTSAIPIVGLYSDLQPDLSCFAPVKVDAVCAYNVQEWEYPCLVNGTWEDFAAHIERELGPPDKPQNAALTTIRGDIGSSWEGWMMSALDEQGRFRQAQRQVVSLRALAAMVGMDNPDTNERLQQAVLETVELGDHAWNGSSPESKRLNLDIRRNRLTRVENELAAVRQRLAPPAGAPGVSGILRIGIANTLGWTRACRVLVPQEWVQGDAHLYDPQSGQAWPLCARAATWEAVVNGVPGFGTKMLEIRPGALEEECPSLPGLELTMALERMGPLLIIGEQEQNADGGWDGSGAGRWQIGPLTVSAQLRPLRLAPGAVELELSIAGELPEEPYELRWLFDLPWPQATWRGESGGGFVTLGPTDRGGDSLLGIVGSVFSCGEGLSAADPEGKICIDLAFDHSGLCGVGQRSTQAAQGTYGERLAEEVVNLSVWDSVCANGRLEWYLLGNKQNNREALLDQGGRREWTVRCVLRQRVGAFDDQALYRFACAANYPAEIVDPAWVTEGPWLALEGDSGILPLHLCREGRAIRVDLYNTCPDRATLVLTGRAVENRVIRRADMLGQVLALCPDGTIEIDPGAYLRVLVE